MAAVGTIASAAFLLPVWCAPLAHSLRPGDHAMHGLFRALPPELTMLNDLGANIDAWRKKQPYGDTEGDAHKGWPADPKAYYVYFLDDGTHGRESLGSVEGFWLRGGGRAEIVVRALEPVRRMHVRIAGGSAGDDLTVRVGGQEQTAEVRPGQTAELTFATSPGFPYYDTFLHRVELRSARGRADRGAFVSIALEVERRPRRP